MEIILKSIISLHFKQIELKCSKPIDCSIYASCTSGEKKILEYTFTSFLAQLHNSEKKRKIKEWIVQKFPAPKKFYF
jgi:hypothetical protein